jgi:hypothetical protein
MTPSLRLNYEAGVRARATTGTVLAWIREPYFERTYGHYSGHANAPYQLENSEFPAVVRTAHAVYFAHALDHLYYKHGLRLHREMLRNAIDLLETQPVLRVEGLPSAGRVSFLQQGKEHRYVAHLLYSPPLQRGSVRVIEDFPPIPSPRLTVRVPERVTKARVVPTGEELSFTQEAGVVQVTLPTFTMHTAFVLEYQAAAQ